MDKEGQQREQEKENEKENEKDKGEEEEGALLSHPNRLRVLHEFYVTEKAYVADLELLRNLYLIPLHNILVRCNFNLFTLFFFQFFFVIF